MVSEQPKKSHSEGHISICSHMWNQHTACMDVHSRRQRARRTGMSCDAPYLCWGDLSLSLFGPPERAAKKKESDDIVQFRRHRTPTALHFHHGGQCQIAQHQPFEADFLFPARDVIFKDQQSTLEGGARPSGQDSLALIPPSSLLPARYQVSTYPGHPGALPLTPMEF